MKISCNYTGETARRRRLRGGAGYRISKSNDTKQTKKCVCIYIKFTIAGETGGAVYWVTYLGAGIPLALIGVGSVAPGVLCFFVLYYVFLSFPP